MWGVSSSRRAPSPCQRKQRIVRRGRLGRIDVDGGAAEMTGREMPGERRFVDDAAARRLNEDRTRFHGCKLGITDHAARRRDQRHVQRHHVGSGQQLLERHRSGAQRLRLCKVAGRRIVESDAASHALEGLRDRGPDRAEPDHAHQQALQSRKVVGQHAAAKIHVPALADLGRRPGEAAQQHRGRGHGVFGDRAVACTGNVGDRNTEPRHRRLVEPVDAGAGDLDETETAALEQSVRKFRPHGRNHQRGGRPYALRQRGVIGLAVGHLQRRRRQRIDARKIGFRPQAKDLERHHDLKSSEIRRSAR